MGKKNEFRKFKSLLFEAEGWQFEIEQLCSLQLALAEVFLRGDYCVDTFAPALMAIYNKSSELNERMEKIIKEAVSL